METEVYHVLAKLSSSDHMLTHANAHSRFILLPNNLRLAQRAPVGEWLRSLW